MDTTNKKRLASSLLLGSFSKLTFAMAGLAIDSVNGFLTRTWFWVV